MDTSAVRHASAHRAYYNWQSKKENVDFIKPDMWSPNSPDLNPVDYGVCGALQQRLYQDENLTRWNNLRDR